jgi:hypothetical protein
MTSPGATLIALQARALEVRQRLRRSFCLISRLRRLAPARHSAGRPRAGFRRGRERLECVADPLQVTDLCSTLGVGLLRTCNHTFTYSVTATSATLLPVASITSTLGTTKNGEGRVFPFTAELRDVLQAQHAEHERLK